MKTGLRRQVGCRHCLDVSDGSMAILVPLTPSAVETTVNGGVTDLHPTVVTSVWTELIEPRQKPTAP